MTQRNEILAHLRKGHSLTRQTAAKKGIFELSARIGELEADGHVISHTWEKRNGKRYMRYRYAGEQAA